ncbi:MAG TPA: TatD family hydrolase [Chitinophagaceae bacterium]|nr:TatD family hydrolase [Chitinophagaceae bacterium]
MLADSHAHLYLPDFAGDLEQVMDRAMASGVEHIFMPNIDDTTVGSMLELENHYPDRCHPMIGLHPCSVGDNPDHTLEFVEDWLGKRPFYGIGEIGLDYHWDLTYRDQQIRAFEIQIDWAMKFGIPVSIHSREATPDCIRLVGKKQDGTLRGVFHCFSGTPEEARQVMGLGFFLGIGGVITFKNSGLDKVLADIPLDHIVLETDAPYLAPVPHRGKRNESSYLSLICEKIASIRHVESGEVAALTSENALNLFKSSLNIP